MSIYGMFKRNLIRQSIIYGQNVPCGKCLTRHFLISMMKPPPSPQAIVYCLFSFKCPKKQKFMHHWVAYKQNWWKCILWNVNWSEINGWKFVYIFCWSPKCTTDLPHVSFFSLCTLRKLKYLNYSRLVAMKFFRFNIWSIYTPGVTNYFFTYP